MCVVSVGFMAAIEVGSMHPTGVHPCFTCVCLSTGGRGGGGGGGG